MVKFFMQDLTGMFSVAAGLRDVESCLGNGNLTHKALRRSHWISFSISRISPFGIKSLSSFSLRP